MRDAVASRLIPTALVLGLLAVPAAVLAGGSRDETGPHDDQDFSKIARGRYLTVVSDCAACHTLSGDKPFAGGKPIETPFGKMLTPNITPDRQTGIGAMSDPEFSDALKRGRGSHGKRLYPAMPYVYMTRMRDEDVGAIRAYLNTVEPVHNAVEADQLPFPFNIRLAMLAWNWLYFTEGDFQPDKTKSEEWNRGAYLVEGPEHCGACHTPKTILGGDETDKRFEGYTIQGWFAPNITGDPWHGLGRWSVDDVVTYLKTGHNRFAAASGPMAEEVTNSSSLVRVEDLRAIAVYLKDQPSPGTTKPAPIDAGAPDMVAGAAIYRDACSACHTPDGRGVSGLIPALNGSPSVQSREPTTVVRVILQGARSVATDGAPTSPAMPTFRWQLDDEQVAAVATYVRNAWGNAASRVTPEAVKKAGDELSARTD